jgi:hypothetical protein
MKYSKFLVIKCTELGDQWECDADRNPVCITDNYNKYNEFGYEIYGIRDNGTFILLKEYEDGKRKYNNYSTKGKW